MDPQVEKYQKIVVNSKIIPDNSVEGVTTIYDYRIHHMGINGNDVSNEKLAEALKEKINYAREAQGLEKLAMSVKCSSDSQKKKQCDVSYLQDSIYQEFLKIDKRQEEAVRQARAIRQQAEAEAARQQAEINKIDTPTNNDLRGFCAGAAVGIIGVFLLVAGGKK